MPVGLTMSLYVMQKIIPGHLKIQSHSGTFISPITLENITYKNDSLQLFCSVLRWNWQLGQLIKHRKFLFTNISINDLYLHLNNTSYFNQRNPSLDILLKKLSWLHKIQINNLIIRNIHIFNSSNHYQLRTVSVIRNVYGNYDFHIQPLNGDIFGRLNASLSADFAWSLYLLGLKINPANIWPSFPGSINFTVKSAGKWGEIKEADLQVYPIVGVLNRYSLNGYLHVFVNDDTITIPKIDIRLADARLFVQGKLKPQNENIKWMLDIPQLAALYPTLAGNLSLNGQFARKAGRPYIDANLSSHFIKSPFISLQRMTGKINTQLPSFSSSLTLLIRNIRFKQYQIPFANLFLLSQIKNNHLLAAITLSLNAFNQVKANLSLDHIKNELNTTTPISGKITLNFKKIENLIKIKSIKKPSGQLQGLFTLSGSLAKPVLNGQVQLLNGQCYLPALGISPHSISLQSHIDLRKPIHLEGSFISGGGNGHLNGEIDINQPSFPYRFNLTGSNLQVANLSAYKIRMNPNLLIQSQNQTMNVTGSAYFPFIEIVTNTMAHGVTLPSEVVIEGQKSNSLFIPTKIAMQVHISLGQHVYLDYQNLKANIAGNLAVSQIAGGLPTAQGILYITRGSYYIYNQFLTIQNGRLIYLGNILTDPGLNISAIKQVQASSFTYMGSSDQVLSEASSLYVGALVQGTLHHPQVSLISNPPMNQDDILSYLLFGSPRSQLAGNSLAVVGTVASSLQIMSPSAGDGTAPQNPLSTGLLKLGMFNPVQVFNFSIPLTKYLMIRTEASIEETGADIMYQYSTN